MSGSVTCPNCRGRSSKDWPFGPCTICRGAGFTTQEKADGVRLQRAFSKAAPDGVSPSGKERP